jgi:hypothetical protein
MILLFRQQTNVRWKSQQSQGVGALHEVPVTLSSQKTADGVGGFVVIN